MYTQQPEATLCCHVCGAAAIDIVAGYDQLGRVTSDCKPWPRGGRLGVCPACGCVQKAIDQRWRADIEQIYADYSIYHQSGGLEQPVFEQSSGQSSSRSARLLECLQAHVALASGGRWLDVGCGNGALLRAASRSLPGWSLAGSELNDKYRSLVEQIDRVEALYTCPPEQVPGVFQVVSMIHVLEHIAAPQDFLAGVWDRLEPGGLLVVEIPDYRQNPFDLLIVDHATHFASPAVAALIEAAGYEVIGVATDWVPKEQTIVARRPIERRPAGISSQADFDAVRGRVAWLAGIVDQARRLAAKQAAFGLFGTSIAATWLFSELEGAPTFFVDEDPHRVGKTYMGRPIYHPQDIPAHSHVLIVLPAALAEAIRGRIARPGGVTFHVPARIVAHDTEPE